MTNGPGPVPMPPVRRLVAAGVRVFAGSDNIRDAWSPLGDGDMLARAMLVRVAPGFSRRRRPRTRVRSDDAGERRGARPGGPRDPGRRDRGSRGDAGALDRGSRRGAADAKPGDEAGAGCGEGWRAGGAGSRGLIFAVTRPLWQPAAGRMMCVFRAWPPFPPRRSTSSVLPRINSRPPGVICSLVAGKKAENFADSPVFCKHPARKLLQIQHFASKFPTQASRGIHSPEQGINSVF